MLDQHTLEIVILTILRDRFRIIIVIKQLVEVMMKKFFLFLQGKLRSPISCHHITNCQHC